MDALASSFRHQEHLSSQRRFGPLEGYGGKHVVLDDQPIQAQDVLAMMVRDREQTHHLMQVRVAYERLLHALLRYHKREVHLNEKRR